MISLKTAKALKDAGLEWEYEYGFPRDCVYYKDKIHGVDGPGALDTIRLAPWQNYVKREYLVFAPSLFQLLAEIEKRGYVWSLSKISEPPQYYMISGKDGEISALKTHYSSDSPEEAAAAALLWVMKEGIA